MLIQNGIIHPVDGPVIQKGFVATRGDKIAAVGTMENLPHEDFGEVFDAGGCHVTPGFIDAHCHLGMFGDSQGFEADDGNECTDPVTPQLRAIDALNPMDRCFEEARRGGVTAVLTGPGSANPIGGQFAAVKTTGHWVNDMILAAPVSMKFAMGENPKTVYHERKETPSTRMATAAVIRTALTKARGYQSRMERAEDAKDVPNFSEKNESLLPVLAGELPVHIHAHRADDIATAVRLGEEFGLDYVIVHGTEGYLVAEELKQAGCTVITGPSLSDRSKPELRNMTIENAALLQKAGVPVAICTDHPVIPIQYLPLCAGLAVRGGMDVEAALEAITLTPAKIGGLEKRMGSLTVGKDANIVVTAGHPFEMMSQVKLVLLDGKAVE
ncbi:MAG: amidohydrolase [Oscillospiraceae bacterium]